VPLDLHGACMQISRPSNAIYAKRFLKSLKKKVREKSRIFTEIETKHLSKIKDLKAFDDFYTAPLHGFKDALDYYNSCSSLNVLDHVKSPALIMNALNDPFLPESCYPKDKITNNPKIYFEFPRRGGHVGFYLKNREGIYWSEKRTIEFINSVVLQ
jgi:predicted alpha/beta-fold hydrolase